MSAPRHPRMGIARGRTSWRAKTCGLSRLDGWSSDKNFVRCRTIFRDFSIAARRPDDHMRCSDDHIAFHVDAVHLKHRLRNVETDCCDRLHGWLLRIVGALTAPTSMT